MQRAREEDGFTLIELMVVVLIIAILIAIAIPTFLGARKRAQDRAAQSSLRNALTSAKTIFTDGEDYSDATTTALSTAEPSLTFNPGTASTGPTNVSVTSINVDTTTTEHEGFAATALSKSGTCFIISDVAGGAAPTAGTHYGSKTTACTPPTTTATLPSGSSW